MVEETWVDGVWKEHVVGGRIGILQIPNGQIPTAMDVAGRGSALVGALLSEELGKEITIHNSSPMLPGFGRDSAL